MILFNGGVKVKHIRPTMNDSFVGSDYSAGLDLEYCPESEYEDSCILPGKSKLVPTGIAVQMPESFYSDIQMDGEIKARSGQSVKRKLEVGAGQIDADYTGEVKVHLYNFSSEPVYLQAGERIAQLVFRPCFKISAGIEKVDQLNETDRGEKGFGSTGS